MKRKTIKDLETLLGERLELEVSIAGRFSVDEFKNGSILLNDSEGDFGYVHHENTNQVQSFSASVSIPNERIAHIHGYIIWFDFWTNKEEMRRICNELVGDLNELTRVAFEDQYINEEQRFFIHIDRVFVNDDYRHYSVAEMFLKGVPAALEAVLHNVCGNVFLFPSPLEYQEDSENFDKELTRLRKTYSRYGFQTIKNSNCMYYDYHKDRSILHDPKILKDFLRKGQD